MSNYEIIRVVEHNAYGEPAEIWYEVEWKYKFLFFTWRERANKYLDGRWTHIPRKFASYDSAVCFAEHQRNNLANKITREKVSP